MAHLQRKFGLHILINLGFKELKQLQIDREDVLVDMNDNIIF